ncbi:MAG: hypothetical protein A2359_04885 [Candidatus Moranbacteria bacterium RIFOXYB1_FULL_43_19]|nr:MAG: hypothetical protein A2359_04885 [Candidatus Moranbacteria bacterium RIFOXYB1_FULL_43_19]OGI33588.1 MAG: hypothetical protein A2420_00515 [Candidatus Moranbacteria bacterium RIFOXYC1_FULL_44_13]OGI37132.1 MAG: hypothetical protein A2612_00045 [Candidatus Moranbacteria bacterium RIFOXYD1_FULL_44_12]
MRIYVRVTPRAGKNEVLKISEGEYKVKVTAPPERGRANEKVIELLACHFEVPKSLVKIIAGKTARVKIIDVG